MRLSSCETLIAAMRILARDIESADGVANCAIAEAADRLELYHTALVEISESQFRGYELSGRYTEDGVAEGHAFCISVAKRALSAETNL